MNLLSVTFGRQTVDNCGACPYCCTIPLTTLKSQANNEIELAGKLESAAQRVLSNLASACLVCNKPACRGIPFLSGTGSKSKPENQQLCFEWKMCIACGVGTHDRIRCPFNKTYMNNRACCECWVFKGVAGAAKHETHSCPVKGRLRRLLSHTFVTAKVPGTFQAYIEQIYTSGESFCRFLSSQETALPTTMHRRTDSGVSLLTRTKPAL